MLPIRDHNPSERTPYVVWGLIIANVVIFLSYGFSLNEMSTAYLFHDWAMTPEMVADGRKSHTLITHMFLHGGFMHLAGNMLFLWIFGDNLEDELGHFGFLLFYLAAGAGAALIHMAIDPSSPVPMVGASGAIAGVMGGYLLLYPKARFDILLILVVFFKVFSVRAWLMLGVWFGFQLLNGLARDTSGGGVAYWAHIGGFLVGLILIYLPWQRRGATAFWAKSDGHPDHPEARYGSLVKSSIPTVRRDQ